MDNCDCNNGCGKGCNCGCNGYPKPRLCSKNLPCVGLRTKVITPQMGTDAEGEPYAPKNGFAFNTIVWYQATGAVYIYDCKGVYTKMPQYEGNCECDLTEVEQSLKELYDPTAIGSIVKTADQLDSVNPNNLKPGEMVLVQEDAEHDNRPSLYYWNPSAQKWVYAYAASPYYQKPYIDELGNNLQININNVMNKEVMDVNNLQTNINAEVNNREAADAEINQRITDLQNAGTSKLPNSMVYDFVSPAGANNPSTANNANITARVVDTTTGTTTNATLMMPMASTAQAGSITAADKAKLDSLLEIKSLNSSLSLDENGQLSVVSGGGSGSDYQLPSYLLGNTGANAYSISTTQLAVNLAGNYYNTATGALTQTTLWQLGGADSTSAGLMISTDKTKLDGLANIKGIGNNLTLDENGTLNASGAGEILQLQETVSSDSGAATTAGPLAIGTYRTAIALDVGHYYGSYTFPTGLFSTSPTVLLTFGLPEAVAHHVTVVPNVVCGVENVTTTYCDYYVQMPDSWPAGVDVTGLTGELHITAIGIATTV